MKPSIGPKATGNPAPVARGHLSDDELQAIDKAVGAQVRLRRILLGLSQQAVSTIIGLTFQQLQKYEHGANRISASRLYQLAQILHVPVSFFFDEIEAREPDDQSSVKAPPSPELGKQEFSELLKKKQTLDLVRDFYALENQDQRRAVLTLLKSLRAASAKS